MKYLLMLLIVFLTACQSESAAENTAENAVESAAENPSEQAEAVAVVPVPKQAAPGSLPVSPGSPVLPDSTHPVDVTIEGKALGLATVDWTGSKANIMANRISLVLREQGNALKLDLEVKDSGILDRGSATYTLPLPKKDGVSVSLRLVDTGRPGLAVNQRIQFSEGSIEIKAVSANSLQMVFKGAGHAQMDSKQFPIEGSVNITF